MNNYKCQTVFQGETHECHIIFQNISLEIMALKNNFAWKCVLWQSGNWKYL